MSFKKICVVVLGIFCFQNDSIVTANLAQEMKKYSPAHTIIILSSNILDESSKCKSEIDLLQQGIDNKKLWSLKILDANGEPTSGFIYGNNFWLGSQRQCFDVTNRQPLEISPNWQQNNSKYRNVDEEFPPFEVNYFVVRFHHNSTIQYHFRMPNEDMISLGLCLPATCTINELKMILEKIFQERLLTINNLYSADFNLLDVTDLKDNYEWAFNWNIITTVIFLIIVFLMATMGTVYDVFIHQKQLNNQELALEVDESPKNFSEMSITMIKKPVIYKEILLCFSAYTNSKKLFDTKANSDSIEMMNGIRFIGMVTLIFLHTGYFSLSFIDNQTWLWRILGNFVVGVLKTQALFVVDTFFFFGGFLSAWLHFKNQQKNEAQHDVKINSNWVTFFNRFIKRIVRLTPVYVVTLCIVQLSFTWASANSLFIISHENIQENCMKYWWRNFLYINNFFGLKSMCMSWSWYLSNDMQFYIISQILLILSDTYFYTSSILLFSLLVLSIITSGYISHLYNLSFTTDDIWFNADTFYFPPWMRIGPYFIGIITAYIFVRMKGKLNVSKTKLCLLWIFGGSCLLAVLLSSAGGIKSVITTAIYIALSRVVWAIGIAWLLIACQTNNAGFLNKILSLNLLTPLSNMSYCVYLLNPVIINLVNLMTESSIHFDAAPFMISALGFTLLTYICAYILTITVEIPCLSIYRVLKKSSSH